ncbi:MAG: hypothetical protein LBK26_04865 [Rickettsiales bacterium]|nr:hypothetical protein [Rickettsiales bacterium]
MSYSLTDWPYRLLLTYDPPAGTASTLVPFAMPKFGYPSIALQGVQ